MIEKIRNLLDKQGYLQIESNVPFVKLYVRYELSLAKVIQLLDCTEDVPLTVEQYTVFCEKSKEHIRDNGYESIDFLTLIVTPFLNEVKKFILNDNHCWIVNSETMTVIVYDNEPEEFYGLRGIIESESIAKDTEPEVYYDGSASRVSRGYTGYYDNTPRQTKSLAQEFTPVNTAMVIFNVIVFFVMTFAGSTEDIEFMLDHGAMFVPAILEDGQIYRFITCIFIHFGFMHLAGNMVVLLFLGDNVERATGKLKFLLIYLLGGIFGSIGSFTYALVYNPGIVSAGASGAIFAVIGALLWLVIRNKGRLEDMTTLRMCVLIAYALYNGFTSENVDMAAHLFGFLGGFLIAVLLYRKNDRSLAV